MTFWDFLSEFVKTGGLAWTLLVLSILGLMWLIAHPIVVKEWNVQISTWIAAIAPKRRKRAYEKRLDLTIDSAKTKFSESSPEFMHRFLPYSLKVNWIDEKETEQTVREDKQIVMYVPTYKNEAKQVVGILHNYCVTGFAENAKVYMSTEIRKASDLIITEKLVQCAGHRIYDFYCREYIPEIIKKDKTYAVMFDRLKKVDTDGLFLPILMNEIDKYSCRIHSCSPNAETSTTIHCLIDFIYNIASRQQGENVNLSFLKNDIKIKIVLAISDSVLDLSNIIRHVEKDIINKTYDTLYVLATGTKIEYAKQIVKEIQNRNIQEIDNIVKTQYKRYTRRPSGSDSICYEINVK